MGLVAANAVSIELVGAMHAVGFFRYFPASGWDIAGGISRTSGYPANVEISVRYMGSRGVVGSQTSGSARVHMEPMTDIGAETSGWYVPAWWSPPAERWLLLCDQCCAVARRRYWTRVLRLFAIERVKMGVLQLQ